MQHVPLKRRSTNILHGSASQKTILNLSEKVTVRLVLKCRPIIVYNITLKYFAWYGCATTFMFDKSFYISSPLVEYKDPTPPLTNLFLRWVSVVLLCGGSTGLIQCCYPIPCSTTKPMLFLQSVLTATNVCNYCRTIVTRRAPYLHAFFSEVQTINALSKGMCLFPNDLSSKLFNRIPQNRCGVTTANVLS
jgi:hypothetical protein